jgi:hypothetical protein
MNKLIGTWTKLPDASKKCRVERAALMPGRKLILSRATEPAQVHGMKKQICGSPKNLKTWEVFPPFFLSCWRGVGVNSMEC